MMLEIEGLEGGYGLGQVLFGVDLAVGEGEMLALCGRNGMGKTTTVRMIFGLLAPTSGDVRFRGKRLVGMKPHRIARSGLGLVPEGRQVFPLLTVEQTLNAMERAGPDGQRDWTPGRVYELFPQLADRRASRSDVLSGGEQQMLALGRALVMNPDLLVLDEATEGLAPLIRREIWTGLQRLKEQGLSILLIDKNLEALIALADQHYIIEKGRVVWQGSSGELAASPDIKTRYLGV